MKKIKNISNAKKAAILLGSLTSVSVILGISATSVVLERRKTRNISNNTELMKDIFHIKPNALKKSISEIKSSDIFIEDFTKKTTTAEYIIQKVIVENNNLEVVYKNVKTKVVAIASISMEYQKQKYQEYKKFLENTDKNLEIKLNQKNLIYSEIRQNNFVFAKNENDLINYQIQSFNFNEEKDLSIKIKKSISQLVDQIYTIIINKKYFFTEKQILEVKAFYKALDSKYDVNIENISESKITKMMDTINTAPSTRSKVDELNKYLLKSIDPPTNLLIDISTLDKTHNLIKFKIRARINGIIFNPDGQKENDFSGQEIIILGSRLTKLTTLAAQIVTVSIETAKKTITKIASLVTTDQWETVFFKSGLTYKIQSALQGEDNTDISNKFEIANDELKLKANQKLAIGNIKFVVDIQLNSKELKVESNSFTVIVVPSPIYIDSFEVITSNPKNGSVLIETPTIATSIIANLITKDQRNNQIDNARLTYKIESALQEKDNIDVKHKFEIVDGQLRLKANQEQAAGNIKFQVSAQLGSTKAVNSAPFSIKISHTHINSVVIKTIGGFDRYKNNTYYYYDYKKSLLPFGNVITKDQQSKTIDTTKLTYAIVSASWGGDSDMKDRFEIVNGGLKWKTLQDVSTGRHISIIVSSQLGSAKAINSAKFVVAFG